MCLCSHTRVMVVLIAFFFFNDTATTEIYTYGHTLSLHDALPIFMCPSVEYEAISSRHDGGSSRAKASHFEPFRRSEEHTSELQSLMRISYAVFCLKKQKIRILRPPLMLHVDGTITTDEAMGDAQLQPGGDN